MNPLLFLRVGYMADYDGPGEISGGGAYVDEHAVGGEVLNFRVAQGKCFGWARTANEVGVDLGRLDPSRAWTRGDNLDGVDVVFFARRPKGGQVIVGFYQSATVLHRSSVSRSGAIPGMEAEFPRYICHVPSSRAHLLDEDKRTFEVPTPRQAGRGFAGQSNVWYPDAGSSKEVSAFVEGVRKFLATLSGQKRDPKTIPTKPRSGTTSWPRNTDAARNALVEACAVNAVQQYYLHLGYSVKSVERENCGWDLDVERDRVVYRIEVKGRSDSEFGFELTPNEYLKLQEHSNVYRVALVCRALDQPEVHVLAPFAPPNDQECWQLRSSTDDVCVHLEERIGASARPSSQ